MDFFLQKTARSCLNYIIIHAWTRTTRDEHAPHVTVTKRFVFGVVFDRKKKHILYVYWRFLLIFIEISAAFLARQASILARDPKEELESFK
jgi:hypothetical protein